MASVSGDDDGPVRRKVGHTDAFAVKAMNKADTLQEKMANKTDKADKQPAGGFDDVPIPRLPPGFTVRITFHKATNLPFADINTLSSDPYVIAVMRTSVPTRHKQDPPLRFRTPTIRRNVNPEWNAEWIIANVPAMGFSLKARLYDEDPADHDDRLGNAYVDVGKVGEDWEGIRSKGFAIKKRMGSKRAYFFRGCAATFSRNVHMSAELFVSVEVLGRTEAESGGRLYTAGPCNWSQHYSPLIGRLVGTKDLEKVKGGKKTERYNFQANQIQLAGPVPEKLYHRYVEFRPFVRGMFTSRTLRGRVLNRALHHQHARIYNYDRTTVYGSFPGPSEEMTRKFLDLVHHDRGGRIYTYVLTLDGLWRFTETGKEFGIDLLSKHTMHSDVNIYIAFSGEFFIRRLRHPNREPEGQETHPPSDIGDGPPGEEPPEDPRYYQLVIDNDSGTYRPNKDLLPELERFMRRALPGLHVTTLDCMADKEKMDRWKDEQRARRKAEGNDRAYAQADSDSSISSSDEEELDAVAGRPKRRGKLRQLGHDIAEPRRRVMHWATGGGGGGGGGGEGGEGGIRKGSNHSDGDGDDDYDDDDLAAIRGRHQGRSRARAPTRRRSHPRAGGRIGGRPESGSDDDDDDSDEERYLPRPTTK